MLKVLEEDDLAKKLSENPDKYRIKSDEERFRVYEIQKGIAGVDWLKKNKLIYDSQ